jgi:hypothetical protein
VALSEDQKAILRLLAQRGAAGYDDLAALLGVEVEEVHRRAKDAASQLESEGIPAPEIPLPSGEAGGGPSGGSRLGELPAEGPPPAQPKPPKAKAEKPKALPKGPAKPPLRRELKLLEGRGLWAILAGAAIVVLFVVIVVVGGGGGSNSDSTTAANTASTESCNTTAKSQTPTGKTIEALAVAAVKTGKDVTRAVLDPVDGSEAKGLAVFGRVKKSLALQVAAEGLPPSGSCSYTIWIAASPKKMLPLATTAVRANGVINAQVEVPVEVLGYLANETFGQIAITRTDKSQLEASLAKATKEKQAPLYTGTEVLRGSVQGPIVGAAKKRSG